MSAPTARPQPAVGEVWTTAVGRRKVVVLGVDDAGVPYRARCVRVEDHRGQHELRLGYFLTYWRPASPGDTMLTPVVVAHAVGCRCFVCVGLTHGRQNTYKRGCRCESCTAANTAVLARYRKGARERLAADPQGASHGANAYKNAGCRCEVCRAGKAAELTAARRKLQRKTAPRSQQAGKEIKHGLSGYTHQWCRCDICKAAKQAANKRLRHKQEKPRQAGAPAQPRAEIKHNRHGYDHHKCRCVTCKEAKRDSARLSRQRVKEQRVKARNAVVVQAEPTTPVAGLRRAARLRLWENKWQAATYAGGWRGLLTVADEVPGLRAAWQRVTADPGLLATARTYEGVALLVAIELDPTRRSHMTDDMIKACDPGIRNTVAWLRTHGFRTTDSGDGRSKLGVGEDPDILDTPHVIMVVAPEALVGEADRLLHLLNTTGVPGAPGLVQASYDPVDGVAVLALLGVDDVALNAWAWPRGA